MAVVWEGHTDPGVYLPAPPSLLWSLVLLLVQAHLFLPAQWKENQIQHGAHLDVLRQRLCCITNTCLPGLGQHPLKQRLRAPQCLYRHLQQQQQKVLQHIFHIISKGDGLGDIIRLQLQGTSRAFAGRAGSLAINRGGWETTPWHSSKYKNTGDRDKHTHLGSWLPLLTLATLQKERRRRSAAVQDWLHTLHQYTQRLH